MSYMKLEFEAKSEAEMLELSEAYLRALKTRHSVREFSREEISVEVIKNLILSAASAPSGANKQPWKFVVVGDPDVKKAIREAAEAEEKENYDRRFPDEMLSDLDPLGTTWEKKFLEDAPYLIVVFKQVYELAEGKKSKNYYVTESVGIAVGFLLTAIHNAGLVALSYSPSPMGFLSEILNRPENERAFIVIPVGFPKEGTEVPILEKKSFEEVAELI